MAEVEMPRNPNRWLEETNPPGMHQREVRTEHIAQFLNCENLHYLAF